MYLYFCTLIRRELWLKDGVHLGLAGFRQISTGFIDDSSDSDSGTEEEGGEGGGEATKKKKKGSDE